MHNYTLQFHVACNYLYTPEIRCLYNVYQSYNLDGSVDEQNIKKNVGWNYSLIPKLQWFRIGSFTSPERITLISVGMIIAIVSIIFAIFIKKIWLSIQSSISFTSFAVDGQAIIWTNVRLIYWHIHVYVSLSLH